MPFIPLILIFIFFGTITYYLARRCFQCLSFIFPRIPFWPILIFHSIGVLSIIVGFLRSRFPISYDFKHLLAVISAYAMGFYFYLFLITAFVDAVVSIYRLIRRYKKTTPRLRFISGIIAITMTIATVGYGIIHANQLPTATYDIRVKEKALTREWNIVLISDIHLGAVNSENRLEKIVKNINNLNPDIVCIAGDFFDNDYEAIKNPDKAIETLKMIDSNFGVYMCLGNHDAGKSFPNMLEFLDRCNIMLLNDTYTVIDNELCLVGRVNRASIGGFGEISRNDTNSVMKNINSNLITVVMDHDPANIDEYGSETDLILSGHTHNGHLFPGNIINEFNYTVNYGYYQRDKNSPHVIVTSGAGTWGMPMRVGTDSEIAHITLHP